MCVRSEADHTITQSTQHSTSTKEDPRRRASKGRTLGPGGHKDWHGRSSITNERLGRGESESKSEEWDNASH